MKRFAYKILRFLVLLPLAACSGSLSDLYFSKLNMQAQLVLSGADFGALQAWQSTTKLVSLTNAGSASAKSLSVNLGSTFGNYAYTGGSYPGTSGTCGTTLAAGQSCLLDITFTPHAFGSQNIDPVITYSDSTSHSTTVQITGSGTRGTFSVIGSQAQGGFDADVWQIVPSADGSGKVYVAGEFSSCQGHAAPKLARLNADGSFDSTFNVGTGPNGTLWAIGLDTGLNQLYVAGDFTAFNGTNQPYIVRLTAAGAVDTGFLPAKANTTSMGGGMSYNFFGHSLLIPLNDGSGKLYLAGNNGASSSNSLVRLNSNGSLDHAFTNGCTYVTAMALAQDGSGDIYVAGHDCGTGFNQGPVRVTSADALDGTFLIGTGLNGFASTIVPLAGGSVVFGGAFTKYNGTTVNGIVKTSSTGTIDATFNTGSGFLPTPIAGDNYPSVISITPINAGTSGFYVVGQFTSYKGTTAYGAVQINTDGSLNSTLQTSFEPALGADFIDYLAGFYPYPGFNTGTITSYQFNNIGGSIMTIAPATDGSGDLWIGGAFGLYQGKGANNLIKVTSQGAPTGTSQVSALWGAPTALAPLNDGSGQVYVGGAFDSYDGVRFDPPSNCNGVILNPGQVIRLNYNGSLDTSFSVSSPFTGGIRALASTSDRKVFVSASNCNVADSFIRFNTDGTIDASYSGTIASGSITSMAADSSGHIYLVGSFTLSGTVVSGLARINQTDGSFDSTFNTGSGFTGTVYGVLPQSDGTVYAVGSFTAYNGTTLHGIVRLLANGSIDSSFSPGSGFTGTAGAVFPCDDGSNSIYVIGPFTAYQGTSVKYVIRILSNGALDTGFSLDASVTGLAGFLGTMSPAMDGAGTFYLGGTHTPGAYSSGSYIWKIGSTGAIDARFTSGSGFNVAPAVMAPLNDGSGDVYVGGPFGSFNYQITNALTRLSSTGQTY